ncbi:MAG: site-2 protease family protein [Leadbetterella sp.]
MKKDNYLLHIILFVLTVCTTILAGYEWMTGRYVLMEIQLAYGGKQKFEFTKILEGYRFAVPFLLFLTFHEFGHYFMAKAKNIAVSLPYYIPAWFAITQTLGTFGAFIRIKAPIYTKKDYFDIGIAGPLAGFVVAIVCLIMGFSELKSDDYIFSVHPEYKKMGANYRQFLDKNYSKESVITLGESPIFSFFKQKFADPKFIPHRFEMSHYPLLLAGFLGLFFTALNLLPIGQLDGGHILYAMIGKKAFDIVSPVFLVILTTFGGLGFFSVYEINALDSETSLRYFSNFAIFVYITYLTFSRIFDSKLNGLILALAVIFLQLLFNGLFPDIKGYSGILAFAFLIGRFLGVYHPDVPVPEKLNGIRYILGILAMLIFIGSVSLYPIS